ncbi:MAG TPA: GntR family transcriptional regulator, partial [Gaiellales bacterium]|nr:GntR family transcriptional regulator [Gaiellales bacterium]
MLEAASQPLYTRVYRMIADDIASGRLRAGDRLPAERELCQQLSVSRTTVRRAFAALVEDGLIESAAGRGAFVTNDSLAEPPNALMSFSELGARRGLHPTSVVLTRELRQATIEQAELFHIAPGAAVFVLERLRKLDDVPVAVDEAVVPLRRAPELESVDFAAESLYAVLDRNGCAPMRAAYTVEATAASPRDAELLGLP